MALAELINGQARRERARSTNPGIDGVSGDANDIFGSPGVAANNLDSTFNWSNGYGFIEQVTGRRAMPYTDAAYSNSLFWDGRAKVSLAFNSENKTKWSNFPVGVVPRNGVRWGDLNSVQRDAALKLLATALSKREVAKGERSYGSR